MKYKQKPKINTKVCTGGQKMAYIAKNDGDLMMIGFVKDDKDVNSEFVVDYDAFIKALAEVLQDSFDFIKED